MTETLTEAPLIKPPELPEAAIASAAEEKPSKKKVASGKAKFTRDGGNFKQDGSPLLQEYDETYTEDACPNGHDINKIIGERNRHKLVSCVFCPAQFESEETV